MPLTIVNSVAFKPMLNASGPTATAGTQRAFGALRAATRTSWPMPCSHVMDKCRITGDDSSTRRRRYVVCSDRKHAQPIAHHCVGCSRHIRCVHGLLADASTDDRPRPAEYGVRTIQNCAPAVCRSDSALPQG